MLFISMYHRPAIVLPASNALRPTTESWLGDVGGVGVCVRECERVCACVGACVRACVMCLQYTIMIFYPG